MTLEGYRGRDYVLLSYDVRGAERSRAVEVCRIVFGRHRKAVSNHDRTKTENGFIHRPGVVWVGSERWGCGSAAPAFPSAGRPSRRSEDFGEGLA